MNAHRIRNFASQTTPIIAAFALLTTLSLSNGAYANESRNGEHRERRGPPPEAFEACAGAQELDICEVQTPRGESLTGECIIPHRRHRRDSSTASNADQDNTALALVCRPDRPHRRRQSELN